MRNKIFQGTSKTIYQSNEDYTLIMAFNDFIRKNDGSIIEIPGKGAINNSISSFVMKRLDMIGLENHLIEKINMREQLVQHVDILPVQLVVSNVACGRYVEHLGIEEGYVFNNPLIDYRVKNKELKNPVVNEHQILNLNWLNLEELQRLKHKAIRVHDFLTGMFASIGIRLIECKLEFGRVFTEDDSILMLADEISGDNCRLWDIETNDKLGFEAIEHSNDKYVSHYKKLIQRFNI